MQIELDLIANTQQLLQQLQQLKGVNQTLIKSAQDAGNAYTGSFKIAGEQLKQFDKIIEDAGNADVGSGEGVALKVEALKLLKEHAQAGTAEMKKLDAEIAALQAAIQALAVASAQEAAKFAEGSGKKQQALQKEIAALNKLIELSKTPAGAGGQLTLEITKQTKLVQTLTQEIKKKNTEENKPNPGGGTDQVIKKTQSLIGMIRAARTEAFLMGREFGPESPQAQAAVQNLANLEEELDDLKKRTEALNPEAKFQAFGQLAAGIAGGFSAATGALAVFGEESEDVQRAILKVQGALAITQGLNSLLGLKDAIKNVAAVLGITTAAQNANTAAKARNLVVTDALAGKERIALIEKVRSAVAGKGLALSNGVLTVSNAAVGTSSLGAAAGIRAFTAALLANPITAILVGLTAAVAAFFAFRKEVKKATDTADEFLDKMKDFNKLQDLGAEAASNTRKTNLELLKSEQAIEITKAKTRLASEQEIEKLRQTSEENKLKSSGATEEEIFKLKQTFEVTNEKARKAAEIELTNLRIAQSAKLTEENKKLVTAEINELERKKQREKTNIEEIFAKRATLSQKQSGELTEEQQNTFKQEIKQAVDAQDELAKRQRELRNELLVIDQQGGEQRIAINAEIATTLRDEYIKAHSELLNGLNELTEKSNDAQIELLQGQSRVEFMKKQTDEELRIFREMLIAKGQAELNAQARATGQPAKTFTLDVKQEEQIKIIQLAINKKFALESEKILFESETAKLSVMKDSSEKQLKEFEINFAKKATELRRQNVAESLITEQHDRELNEAIEKVEAERLETTAAIQKQIVAERKRGGESVAEFEQQNAIDIKRIDLDLLRGKLFLAETTARVNNDTSESTKKAIADMKAAIGQMEQEIDKAQNTLSKSKKKFKWTDLFGLPDDAQLEAQLQQSMQQLYDSLVEIVNSNFEAESAIIDQKIAKNQEYQQSLEDQSQTLENELQKQEELQKKGYANSVASLKDALKKNDAEKKKALEEERKMVAERRKLAKEQTIFNGILAGIQIILAAATVIEQWSEVPYVGWIIGIAAAAALVAQYMSISNQIKSIESQSFGKGGMLGGKSHAAGGNKYISQDGQSEMVHEEGEFFINKKSTRKYLKVIEAINADRPQMLSSSDLVPLLDGTGVSVRENISKEIMRQQVVTNAIVIKQKDDRLTVVEEQLKIANETLFEMRAEMKKEKTITTNDAVIHTRGKSTTIVKK